MMCHAAHINHEKMEARIDRGRDNPERTKVRKSATTKNPYEHINPNPRATEFEDPTVLGPTGSQKLSEVSTDFEKLAKYLNFGI